MDSKRQFEPTDLDWAKLAAYIDGEDCINITLRQREQGVWHWQAFDILITVANTDIRLPNWCRDHFGGEVKLAYPEHYRKNHKACHVWRVHGKACEWILAGILGHSVIKREQIEIGLAYTATMRGYQGHRKPVPEEMKQIRRKAFTELRDIKSTGRVDLETIQ
jgi:hypothetical protein